ncbi:MAG: sigma-70 family RNA polymerase sigma factor [Candidatus Peregrinibacteria bacterium]|nr:sigma-70 family RNA polymerase sigma factor [Candidatus Peregrinibacteria bacterium]
MRISKSDSLYDGKYPRDAYIERIQRNGVLNRDERKNLERGAHQGRMVLVEVAQQSPLVLLQTAHTLRGLRDRNHSGYNVLMEMVPMDDEDKREEFLTMISQMEDRLAQLIAIAARGSSDEESQQEFAEAAQQMSVLAPSFPVSPTYILQWDHETRSGNRTDAQAELTEKGKKLEAIEGKSRQLLSLLGRIPDIARTLPRLSGDNSGGGMQALSRKRMLSKLAEDVGVAKEAYDMIRAEDWGTQVKSQTQAIQNAADILRLLEEQVLRHGMSQMGLSMGEVSGKGAEAVEATVNGYARTAHELINAHLGMVVSIARKYTDQGVDFHDLIQEGNEFLVRAARSHDPSKGQFTTYTWPALHGVMKDVIRDKTIVRMPMESRKQMRKVKQAREQYLKDESARQEEPEMDKWIAEQTGLARHTVNRSLYWLERNWRTAISLESYIRDTHTPRPAYREDDPEELAEIEQHEWQYLKDTIPYPGDDAEGQQIVEIDAALLRGRIDEVLRSLAPRESEVIKLRYGLLDGHAYTLDEVAETYGITRERIRQIEARAVRKLQHPVRSRRLEEFMHNLRDE